MISFDFVTGIQDLQRELSEKVPAHQTSSVPHLLHQALHQEQLLRGEEPDYCQLPHHVCDRCSGYGGSALSDLYFEMLLLC